jgi:hypothetical protein
LATQTHTEHPEPRVVQAGPWRVTLQPPVRVYQGGRKEFITRPNLGLLGDAVVAIYQTTFDSQATPVDDRHISVSLDGGQTWRLVARNADLGSYGLYSTADGRAVVMPYDSLRFGPTHASMAGPRVTLSWADGELRMARDQAVAHFPKGLLPF